MYIPYTVDAFTLSLSSSVIRCYLTCSGHHKHDTLTNSTVWRKTKQLFQFSCALLSFQSTYHSHRRWCINWLCWTRATVSLRRGDNNAHPRKCKSLHFGLVWWMSSGTDHVWNWCSTVLQFAELFSGGNVNITLSVAQHGGSPSLEH